MTTLDDHTKVLLRNLRREKLIAADRIRPETKQRLLRVMPKVAELVMEDGRLWLRPVKGVTQ